MQLAQDLLGARFQNPVLLASGTCGYGRELAGALDLDSLGGFVTKSITPEPRAGNPAPRVTEYGVGMLNSVGLANVGVAAFRERELPWIAQHVKSARVLVSVAGRSAADFVQVVSRLDGSAGFLGFEINLSCPNVRGGGVVFATREDAIAEVVAAVRTATARPLVAKLAPNVPDIARMAEVAVQAGADAVTLVNTMPGLLFDTATGRPALGAGAGGVSGPPLLPIGVHAVAQARRRVRVPIVGVGGIRTADDAMQYLFAGASLVQIGTASFADPRAAARVLSGLRGHGRRRGVTDVSELIGAGLLPSQPPTSVPA